LLVFLSLAGCGSDGSKSKASSATPLTTASPQTSGASAPSGSATVGTPAGTATGGTLGQILPSDNPWNTPITSNAVHPNSDAFIASIGLTKGLHPDFGTVYAGAPNGIPFITVDSTQALVPINFVAYGNESDPGPYPTPLSAPIEGGPNGTGDRHVIVVDTSTRTLYELYRAFPNGAGGWDADSGAIYDLDSNALRPAGWTSADAAGLPIFPGLVRYDEAVVAGQINHALRFTITRSQRGYVDPARHFASSSTDPNRPPMGLRLRLKASVDISGFPPEVQVILQALKTYGMIVADNGGDWFISGAPDSRWNDSNLATLSAIKGQDFEAVYTGPTITQ
jgi:hypothetical protein